MSAPLCRHSVWLAALWIALLGCNHNPGGPLRCGYVLNLALLQPPEPHLNIGDTLTMRATFDPGVARQCLPPDTTAAGLRWWTANGVVAIDSLTGHLTALHPGLGLIYLAQVGVSDAALGSTGADVLEPAGADSVVTIVRNLTGDSAWVILEDGTGVVQRSQTVGARDSACWVTSLSDSVRYSVTIRPPPPPIGSDSTMARWVTHSALEFNHTWRIAVESTTVQSVRTVTVILFALAPDPGTGC